MKWSAIVILAAVIGNPASAQPPVISPQPAGPVLMPPTVAAPVPQLPTGPGFYKSGGVFVGGNGHYPYDTGYYLLGGTDGFARSTGTFTMVYPSGAGNFGESGSWPAGGICAPGPTVTRARHFRH